MILTCPACGTQYVVKDGAIPPAGRQVRCAACKHSWHQDPDPVQPEPDAGPLPAEIEEAPPPFPPAEDGAVPAAADDDIAAHSDREWPPQGEADAPAEDFAGEREPRTDDFQDEPEEVGAPEHTPAVAGRDPGAEEAAVPAWQPSEDSSDGFSPFAYDEEPEPRRRWPALLAGLLLIAALAAAFWFLAPPAWKQSLGIGASGETPLQLMMTHSDRQKLASGNELLAVSGRVINPTDQRQQVPPIQAQLRSRKGELVYSWTIAPPARTLPPRASATFNSAEVNVPSGGDELTITLGSPRA